jgi:hypothetical protein
MIEATAGLMLEFIDLLGGFRLVELGIEFLACLAGKRLQ